MLDRIIEILNEWDPIELIAIGCPDDEYEPEAKAILAEMEKTSDETRLAKKYTIYLKLHSGMAHFCPIIKSVCRLPESVWRLGDKWRLKLSLMDETRKCIEYTAD